MKRGKPLKRRTPLERRTELKSGGEGMLRRAALAVVPPAQHRSTGLAPGKRKTRPKVPEQAKRAARARTEGWCAMCLHVHGLEVPLELTPRRLRVNGVRGAEQLHHVLPVREWPELAKLAENLVGLCEGCHDEHERAHRRLPRSLVLLALPLAEVDGARLSYFERTYPLTAAAAEPRH